MVSVGRMASIAIAITAVVALFAYIPIVSEYAFWVLVGAYLLWEAVHRHNTKIFFRHWHMLSTALLILSIVGLLTDIPILSTFAFWVLALAYLVLVGTSRFSF
jgi:hypothetical protein